MWTNYVTTTSSPMRTLTFPSSKNSNIIFYMSTRSHYLVATKTKKLNQAVIPAYLLWRKTAPSSTKIFSSLRHWDMQVHQRLKEVTPSPSPFSKKYIRKTSLSTKFWLHSPSSPWYPPTIFQKWHFLDMKCKK